MAQVCPECEVARVYPDGENKQVWDNMLVTISDVTTATLASLSSNAMCDPWQKSVLARTGHHSKKGLIDDKRSKQYFFFEAVSRPLPQKQQDRRVSWNGQTFGRLSGRFRTYPGHLGCSAVRALVLYRCSIVLHSHLRLDQAGGDSTQNALPFGQRPNAKLTTGYCGGWDIFSISN